MSICCADIPRLPGLESISFRAGLTGGQRIVRCPYVVENDAIQPCVSSGELFFANRTTLRLFFTTPIFATLLTKHATH